MIPLKPAKWILQPRRWQKEAFALFETHINTNCEDSVIIQAIMGSGKSILIGAIASSLCLNENQVIVISTSTEHLTESLYDDLKKISSSVGVWYGKRKKIGKIIVTCIPSVASLTVRLKILNQQVVLWIADEAHKTECDSILNCYEALNPMFSIGFTATAFRSIRKQTLSLFEKCIYKYGVAEAINDGVVVPWKIVNWNKEIPSDINNLYIEMIKDASGPGLINADDINDAEQFADFLTKKGIPAKAIHSKCHTRDRKKIIDDLKHNILKCIVHVNLLAEGANFPWLKWCLLRRQVEARVRFIQEIGRLLRSYPCKTEAIFYDPHDLFGNFALSYKEALGEVIVTPKEMDLTRPEEIIRQVHEADDPMIITTIESSIRALTIACDTISCYPRRILTKLDKLKPSTEFQAIGYTSMLKNLNGTVPETWKNYFGMIKENTRSIRFGFMADLLWVLSTVKEMGKWLPITNDCQIGRNV